MKRNLLWTVIAGMLLTVLFSKSYGQENKDLVKLNLFPLTTGAISLEYEREIAKKITVGSMVTLMPEKGLPYASSIKSLIGDDSDDKSLERTLDATKLGSFSIAPEVRFYLSKGAYRGFYLGPYVKYSSYKLKTEIAIDEDAINPDMVAISGSMKGFTAGLSIGTQFKLANNVFLDWRIIGPGYGVSSGKISGTTDYALSQDEQRELQESIDDLTSDIPLIKAENTVTANGLTSKISGPWAGIRTALSIGYRF